MVARLGVVVATRFFVERGEGGGGKRGERERERERERIKRLAEHEKTNRRRAL